MVVNMSTRPGSMDVEDQKLLDAYIYDYLVKQSYGDAARALLKEAKIPTISEEESKRRLDGSENPEGTTGAALDNEMQAHDDKEHRANGMDSSPSGSPKSDSATLPSADIPINIEGGFLPEWWTMFWDMFAARQGRPSSNSAANFIAYNQRLRADRQAASATANMTQTAPASVVSQMTQPGQVVPGTRAGQVNGVVGTASSDNTIPQNSGEIVLNPNGPMNAKTREALMRQAMMNNGQRKAGYPPTPSDIQRLKTQQFYQQQQQQQQLQAQQQQQHQQLNRDEADRAEGASQSHTSPIVSVPSPSKRQRLSPDGAYAQIPGNMRLQQQGLNVSNGPQTQQLQQAQQMLLKAGINPSGLSPSQFQAFQAQTPGQQQHQLSMYVSGLASHHNQQRAQQQGAKGPGGAQPGQMVGASPVMQNAEGSGPPQESAHALQDYQMQLMLLEQQNKKRLLMARQEQDRLQQPSEAQQGPPFNTNSPQSRMGGSPPGRDLQRGTPKMGNQHNPKSPPDQAPPISMQAHMQGLIPRNASPAVNFNPNQGPPGSDSQQQMMYRQAVMQQQHQENGAMPILMGPQGPGMRPSPMQFPPGHPAHNNPQVMQQMMQSQEQRKWMMQQQQMIQQQMQQNGHMQRMTPQQQHQHAMAQQHAHSQQQAQQAQQAQQHHHAQQQHSQQAQGPSAHQQMPPPSAPAQQIHRGPSQQGQPPSPSLSNNQPPTPVQQHAKAVTRKSGAKDSKKGVAKTKKNGQPATPAASEPPTPTTPATPLQAGNAQFGQQGPHPGQNSGVGHTADSAAFSSVEGVDTGTNFSINDFVPGGEMDMSVMGSFYDFESFLAEDSLAGNNDGMTFTFGPDEGT